MFVAYCVIVLKKAPTSIPGILSGLKNNLVLRFVHLKVFDNSLLVAMKAAVKRIPYSPRVRLPCTYSMVLYIIQQNRRPFHVSSRSQHGILPVPPRERICYQNNSTPNQWSSNVCTPATSFRALACTRSVGPASRLFASPFNMRKTSEEGMASLYGSQQKKTTHLLVVPPEHTASRRPLPLVSVGFGYPSLPRVVANNASTLYLTVEELLSTYNALMMPRVI